MILLVVLDLPPLNFLVIYPKTRWETLWQPNISFPNWFYGRTRTTRSFQASWYNDYPWIEYSQQKDAAFCFCCRFFNVAGIPADPAFTKVGFRDWKHACGKKGSFVSHVSSHAHKSAMLNWQQFKLNMEKGTTVGARLDQERRRVINSNCHYVKALVEVILVCAQQGLALRGHSDAMDDSSINPGNFRVSVKLLSKHDDIIKKCLEEGSQNATFLGHDIQNELVAVMGRKIIEKIQTEVSDAQYYTIITNESKDISKKVNYPAVRLLLYYTRKIC